MEHGVSSEACADAPDEVAWLADEPRSVTDGILGTADAAGHGAALIDASDGSVTAWPRLAYTIRTAACGLACRGVAAGDTVGVFVRDAASFAIAVNAIRAAGAAAAMIGPGTPVADVAGRLDSCGARLLITSAALAAQATDAADRSRVRQVIAFGDAAETTPFSSLLGRPGRPGQDLRTGPAPWPGTAPADGMADGGQAFTRRDIVITAPPCGDEAAYTALLDRALLAGATLVAAPLPLVTAALRVYQGTAAIVPAGTQIPGLGAGRVHHIA